MHREIRKHFSHMEMGSYYGFMLLQLDLHSVVHLLTLHINFHFQEGREQKRQCAKIRKGNVSS